MSWLTLILLLSSVTILTILVKILLRETLHIKKEKRRFFSYNHINDAHRKIDWAIRIVSGVISIFALYLSLYQDYSFNVVLLVILLFAVAQYITQAFFEWKYTSNPKQTILTVSEMLIWTVTIGLILQLDLLVL